MHTPQKPTVFLSARPGHAPPWHGPGVLAAAQRLLAWGLWLREAPAPDVGALRQDLWQELSDFTEQAGPCPEHSVDWARHALCCFLDETVAHTAWGHETWAQQSLLTQWYQEAWGGETFFEHLEALCKQAKPDPQLLELFLLLLAFGFTGRYRLLNDGTLQLVRWRQKLQSRLAHFSGSTGQAVGAVTRPDLPQATSSTRSTRVWWGVGCGVLLSVGLGLRQGLQYQAQGLQTALPRLATPKTSASAPALPDWLATEVAHGSLEIRRHPQGWQLTWRGDGWFAPGSANIAPEVRSVLTRLGQAIAADRPRVLIRGHTDNQAPGKQSLYRSNHALSQARANAARDILQAHLGESNPIVTEGRADLEPVADNTQAQGRARNRRIEVWLSWDETRFFAGDRHAYTLD